MKEDPIFYTDGAKYKLEKSWFGEFDIIPENDIDTKYISLSKTSETTALLRVKVGFTWDGPSGPTWDTKDSMKGSLVHDAFCRLMAMGLLDRKWKIRADEIAGEVWDQSGMNDIRRKIWVSMLKPLDFYVQEDNVRDIIQAP